MNTFSKKNLLVLIIALVVIFAGFNTARIVAHRAIRASQNSTQSSRSFNNSGDRSSPGQNFRMPQQERKGFFNRGFLLQRRMPGMMMNGPRYVLRQYHGQLIKNPAFLVPLVIGMLGIITIGILVLFLVGKVAKKINTFCDGDGRKTTGAIKFLLLCIITCGIYSLLWLYMLGDRMQENASLYNLTFKESGGKILLWFTLGLLIIAGPFVALYIVFKNTDKLEAAYSKAS